MFHSNSHLNKHGFFEVGGSKFYSKLDAIQHSVQTGTTVEWNFNNEVYQSLDWTVEPAESIRELYAQRARALREQYDYLVCMFSGGSDSTTVLQTFIDNGIPVDEIFMNYWPKGCADNFMNHEITNAAVPFLEKNLPKSWNCRVRLYDYTDFVLECLEDPDHRQRSYREVNNVHNLSMISMWKDLQYRFPEYMSLHDQGKSIAFIWGEAKPHIDYDMISQKHFFFFEDHYAHAPQPRDQEANDLRCNHEQFYNDPEHASIKVKQAHLLLRTLKQVAHRRDIFVSKQQVTEGIYTGPRGFKIKDSRGCLAHTYYNNEHFTLDRNAFNCSIYPSWNFLTYHEDKQAGRLIHPAHAWIGDRAPAAAKDWFTGYIKTYGALPEAWTRHRGSLEQGLKRLQIKYYLE